MDFAEEKNLVPLGQHSQQKVEASYPTYCQQKVDVVISAKGVTAKAVAVVGGLRNAEDPAVATAESKQTYRISI